MGVKNLTKHFPLGDCNGKHLILQVDHACETV